MSFEDDALTHHGNVDVVVVYTVGSLIRVEITNAASKIMFEDLPQVDRILEMCRVRIGFTR